MSLCAHCTLCAITGYGGLSLSIEGPSKVDINTEDLEDGTCKVTYCPTEPGNYIINIKFADQHVPGDSLDTKLWMYECLNTKYLNVWIYVYSLTASYCLDVKSLRWSIVNFM